MYLWILAALVSNALTSDIGPYVAVTVSAEDRNVEVSWRGIKPTSGAHIVLLQRPPREVLNSGSDIEKESLGRIVPESDEGWITTNVPYNYNIDYDLSVQTSACYGFWVAYLSDNNTLIAENCFRTRPTWMGDMREEIQQFRFRELFIPGTHDSAAYINRFNPKRKETYVTKYTVTQEENIYSQLVHGIRYLDIRVGYYNIVKSPFVLLSSPKDAHKFWANHGPAKMQPLQHVLEQIVDFVNRTNEIVIVDVQEFPVGFEKGLRRHEELIRFIQEHVGDHMARPDLTWRATLGDIWREGRRIIVAYDHERVLSSVGNNILWQAVEQQWGNVKNLDSLQRHLTESIRTRPYASMNDYRPVAHMAELTADIWDILSDRLKGLRRMADSVNRHVSKWYKGEWGREANIVAVDFFKGTDIVETAIAWNERKTKS